MIAIGASLQEQTFRLTDYVDLEDLRFLKLGTLAHNLVPYFLYRGLSSCFVHSRSLANVSDEAFGKGACLGFGILPSPPPPPATLPSTSKKFTSASLNPATDPRRQQSSLLH